jgi:hypothetical protein
MPALHYRSVANAGDPGSIGVVLDVVEEQDGAAASLVKLVAALLRGERPASRCPPSRSGRADGCPQGGGGHLHHQAAVGATSRCRVLEDGWCGGRTAATLDDFDRGPNSFRLALLGIHHSAVSVTATTVLQSSAMRLMPSPAAA